jgi:hypothetical protein
MVSYPSATALMARRFAINESASKRPSSPILAGLQFSEVTMTHLSAAWKRSCPAGGFLQACTHDFKQL